MKNSIQKVKQAAAKVLKKASSGKSKGGTAANRCGVELSKNKIEKRIGDPFKPFADEILRNAKQTVSKISPSVKPVSGTQASCSAQDAISSAEVRVETWTSTMWWLTTADGPAPVGDSLYLGGVIVLLFIWGTAVANNNFQTSNFVILEPQRPTIILDPPPDIASPQIEVIPKHNPEKGENVIPLPIPEVEVGGNITGIPVQEEEGVRIITADGSGEVETGEEPKTDAGGTVAWDGSTVHGYNGFDTKVNIGQQNKHVLGTNENKVATENGQNKSVMYGTLDDIQILINEYSGTGTPINANKERVDFGMVIGQYYDVEANQFVDTTVGIIHYGKNGAHIVPARPN